MRDWTVSHMGEEMGDPGDGPVIPFTDTARKTCERLGKEGGGMTQGQVL